MFAKSVLSYQRSQDPKTKAFTKKGGEKTKAFKICIRMVNFQYEPCYVLLRSLQNGLITSKR